MSNETAKSQIIDPSSLIPGDYIYVDYDSDKVDSRKVCAYRGEYIFLHGSPFSATVVRPGNSDAVWEFHSTTTIDLKNQVITDRKRSDGALVGIVNRVLKAADDVLSGRAKANWTESVYHSAKARAEALVAHLEKINVPQRVELRTEPLVVVREKVVTKSEIPKEYAVGRFLVTNGVYVRLPDNATITATVPPLVK